jgi:hypothetical protein
LLKIFQFSTPEKMVEMKVLDTDFELKQLHKINTYIVSETHSGSSRNLLNPKQRNSVGTYSFISRSEVRHFREIEPTSVPEFLCF